jgi:hypothetical protein
MSGNGMTVGVQQFQQTQQMQQASPFGGDRPAGLDRNINEAMANTAASAMIQARFAMALRRPRSWTAVREAVLKDCKRPGFAATAIYSKPVGKSKVEGFSVRFVERVLNLMGNVSVESTVKFDSESERLTSVEVIDLETNSAFSSDVVVSKTVERSSPNGEVLGSRKNSRGYDVYIVRATDDDVLIKQAALVSKAMRTLGLRMVPGDILDEARATIGRTISTENAKDPDKARKDLIDGFSRLGISAKEIERWLGHSADEMSGDEFKDLREIGIAVSDNETTWREVMAAREEQRAQAAPATAPIAQVASLPEPVRASVSETLLSCQTPTAVAKLFAKMSQKFKEDGQIDVRRAEFSEAIGAMLKVSSPELSEDDIKSKAASILDGRRS